MINRFILRDFKGKPLFELRYHYENGTGSVVEDFVFLETSSQKVKFIVSLVESLG